MVPRAFERSAGLDALADESFDVLVVGGGITGCGVALDAAARGLRTALVEAGDFASGTSSRSSKMVHGGLRYLQQHDYLLVYEALRERQRLIRNAPHLVHPLPFLIPLFGREGVLAEGLAKAYSAALWTYDITGGVRIGRRHRRVGAEEALAHFPQLRTDRLVAAFLYWDAQADDARLTLAIARTAALRGAVLVNHAPVAGFLRADGTVRGARLWNGLEVRAAAVVNATGVWSDAVSSLAGGGSPTAARIRPAKGIHLAVPAAKLPCDQASVLAVPGDRRSIFVVPWAADEAAGTSGRGRFTYLGTTDTDYEGPLDDPHCTPEDVEYVLRAVNAWTSAELTADDVTGTWAGLRPLISGARSERTADLSRRHRVTISANGLVTVTGGKLTTYRRMAADTVDAVVGRLDGRRRARRSPTGHLPLVGAERRPDPARVRREGRRLGVDSEAVTHLMGRHGSEAAEILRLCDEDPALAAPLVPGMLYLRAEAIFSARHEMAHTLEDILSRRTRASILDRESASSAAEGVALLVAGEMGWTDREVEQQVAGFRARLDAERLATTAAAEPSQ